MNDRMQWLEERRSGLGGSDIAAVIGISPWRTPVQIWMDKTAQTPLKEDNKSLTLQIGNELENMVARLYSEHSGMKVRNFNTMLRKGCMIGNVDRLVVMPGQKVASHRGEVRTEIGLECKTTSQPVWTDVPIYYLTQVMWYMGLIPQIKRFDLASLFMLSKDFKVYSIDRDDEIIGNLQEQGKEFWYKYVLPKVMPPPINEADCKLLWSRSNPGKRIDADEDIEETVRHISALKMTIKDYESQLKRDEDKVKAYMGDSEILSVADGKPIATWKSGKDRTVTDWKGIASELGYSDAQFEKYTATKPGNRTFLLK